MLSVSNVIYHNFSHGAAFYTLNGKNVNVMLESKLTTMVTTEGLRGSETVVHVWEQTNGIIMKEYSSRPNYHAIYFVPLSVGVDSL